MKAFDNYNKDSFWTNKVYEKHVLSRLLNLLLHTERNINDLQWVYK